MKMPVRTASWIAAFLSWILMSSLVIFIIIVFRDRAELKRDSENERLLNMLFTSLRDYDDFGSAIESNDLLKERIAGFAIYGNDDLPLYSWGNAPGQFDESILPDKTEDNRYNRFTIANSKSRSVIFVIKTGRIPPPPPKRYSTDPGPYHDRNEKNERIENPFPRRSPRQEESALFNTFFMSNYYYIDISHPAYWRTLALTATLGPAFALAILVLAFFVRRLFMRNREYRAKIEAQKNLVVLGTAAATLAHEIKNPLLSIRIQTGILAKLYGGKGDEELAFINEEVDRLSALTYRVGDYLREGKGKPEKINIQGLICETARRLCGGEIIFKGEENSFVFADPERLRSVFENLIRNALEAGSPPESLEAEITKTAYGAGLKTAPAVSVIIRDRGLGIAESDIDRVFDPFFTGKSTGTGIGLSVSKRFAEAAGGSIGIRNREGGGAEVKVTLPEYIQTMEPV
jgi:two-component system sensor histidine kinase HydH